MPKTDDGCVFFAVPLGAADSLMPDFVCQWSDHQIGFLKKAALEPETLSGATVQKCSRSLILKENRHASLFGGHRSGDYKH